MSRVYITYAKRTPIGKYGGLLSNVRPDDLLTYLIQDFKNLATFDLKLIGDVIVGCANQAGEDNRNIARMSSILAGLPFEIPGTTINRLCGSSLDAVMDSYARIKSGLIDCAIVGGVESMSRAPLVLSKSEHGFSRNQKIYDTTIGWRFPNKSMEKIFPLLGMGETAEEVARQFKISREDQDQFALQSHQKALKAQSCGLFKNEILPINIAEKNSNTIIENDEGPRTDTSLEKLQKLSPVFKNDGSVTAGNSSSINDGAALLFVASEDFVTKYNLTPLCEITGAAVAGVHPNIMGIGPVEAVEKLKNKFFTSTFKFDLIELNEAFASQSLACIRELDLDPTTVNINGGAIALGHPLGASGSRILTTLIHNLLRDSSQKTGLASMCIGVGQGIALSIQKM
ncbi:MAG: acetyl-CoA C-acyltransferase [Halobacteriovoraceae bacterium]|nr:acetyl-CoA C-acyltransferase [Halobacteriovoraceae bacterium]